MATHTTLAALFSAIADKIRSHTKTSGTIIADNLPAAIDEVYAKGVSDGIASGGEPPTEFTNYARLSSTKIQNNYRINSTGNIGASSGNAVISFENPKAGSEFKLVWRGAFIANGATNIAAGSSSSVAGTLISADVDSACLLNEQADFYITVPADKSLAWIHFSFAGLTSERYPIIAIDEFIGNGGYVSD